MSENLASPFRALLAVELRMLARDKRTLFASVLLPTLLMPLFFVASSFGEAKRQERKSQRTFSYAIEGSEAAGVRDLLALALGQADTNTGIRLEEIQSEADPGDLEALPPPSASTFETLGVHAIVRAISAAEAQAVDAAGGDEGPGTEEVPRPRVTLYFLADSDASSTAVGALEDLLERALLIRQDALLSDAGFPIERSQMGSIVERTDVATASERTGSSIGRWAPLFLMLFLVIGGSVVAADTLAGEKERGTLETLLGSAASRRDIIGAKLTAIFSLGLVITVIQLANLALYAGLRIIDVPADFSVKLGPGVAVALLVLFLPLALLSAAALLWASGRSSTYKAFQIALFPLMLALIAPATAALLPGLELRSAVAAAPIAGVAVAVREVLVGRIDLPFLALAWLSTALAAALLVRTALIDLSDERLLTGGRDRAAHLGGIDLLSRHVLRYYAVGWAVIFLVSAGLSFGLRGQVLFNIVGVFFVGSLLLLKAYRLPVRRTLALRPVCGSVWAGVLLGAPSMFFVAAAVSQLSARFFPLPQEALERLGQGLLPADMGLFELLFFVAVLPGLCEEVAFRGVLLQALRRRLAPYAVVLISAAVFAVFHFEWVRLLPTFFLGVLLALLTYATGSLWPAIVWHLLNNASAILLSRAEVDITQLSGATTAWAAVAAVLAVVLIARGRSSLPALDDGGGGIEPPRQGTPR